jgi:hypothetical protein
MGRATVNADDTTGPRGFTLTMAPGVRLSGFTAPDGDVHAELPCIRSVGIRDLTQVIEHRISYAFESVGHYVRFTNGGWLRYIFNGQGDVIEFYIIGLDAVLSAEGEVIVRQPQS